VADVPDVPEVLDEESMLLLPHAAVSAGRCATESARASFLLSFQS
jgi:hypothetical protein